MTKRAEQEARKIFAGAWNLFVKYADGPPAPDCVDRYWSNLNSDVRQFVQDYPCGIAEDLAAAVYAEHVRREKINRKKGA